jgi:hypothetical protein
MTDKSRERRASLGLWGVSMFFMWLLVEGNSHEGQMALLQHSSLYESMAS